MKKPLVEGINPLNTLDDFGDLFHAEMDILILVEDGTINHIDGTYKICEIFKVYQGGCRNEN